MSEPNLASPQEQLSDPLTPRQGENGPSPEPTPPKRRRGRPRKTSLASLPTEQQMEHGGLGLKARKALHKQLTRRGIPEPDLPIQLQDVIVKKSRKGKAGQIVVRALSGVQKTSASVLARRLEHDIARGEREDLLEKLQASPTQSQSLQRVVAMLEEHPQFSLARAIAEAGADVAHVLDNYAKGALALKKLETVLELYQQMPNLMRDLARHAIDEEVDCATCLGLGLVTGKAGGVTLNKTCPVCRGTKKVRESSEHKEFAAGKLLEMSDFLPKKGGLALNVNQAVQVNSGAPEGDLLARMSKAADEILYSGKYNAPQLPEAVDAEVLDD